MPTLAFTIPCPPDFSFQETLDAHGWRQLAPFTWDDAAKTLSRVEQLSDGRVIELLIQEDAGALKVTESDGADVSDQSDVSDVSELTTHIRRMFQLDLPLDEFHAYCATRPDLCHIPGRKLGRMLCSPTLFEDTVKVIATANTTWAQTKAMTRRVCDSFGAPLSGDPSRRAFPTPADIAALSLDEFSAKARMGYRNGYVHAIATSIVNGSLDLEAWRDPSIPAADLRKRLLSLPGIGPYGASCLMLYLGKPEHVTVDSWARMMLGKELGRQVTDKEVHDFFDGYGAWKGLVYYFYDWRHK
jgi:3-methyladenine DNA glycosylase/8-oxoguanine DNA glycosylase